MLTIVCCLCCILKLALNILKIMKKKAKVLIEFGTKVRELRTEKNVSQEQLAFDADLHRTYIGMIERAEKNVTLINIEKIAKALNVNIRDLFN